MIKLEVVPNIPTNDYTLWLNVEDYIFHIITGGEAVCNKWETLLLMKLHETFKPDLSSEVKVRAEIERLNAMLANFEQIKTVQ